MRRFLTLALLLFGLGLPAACSTDHEEDHDGGREHVEDADRSHPDDRDGEEHRRDGAGHDRDGTEHRGESREHR